MPQNEDDIRRAVEYARRQGDRYIWVDVDRLVAQADLCASVTALRERIARIYAQMASEVLDIAGRIGPARMPESIRDELLALARRLQTWDSAGRHGGADDHG